MPLAQPVPDLEALDLLVSVSELGSISAAAAAHGITQPAASMRLRSLERVLGITLLDRARTGARMTDAGTATVEWAAAALRDVQALMAGVAALRAEPSHLHLAASLTVAEYLLPRWLAQLSATLHTTVSLQMGNTAHVGDLVARGEVDLGFIEGPHPPGRLHSRDLLPDELVVVVPPGHPWARRRRPLTPALVARTPLVLRELGSGTREVLTEALAGHGLQVSAAMELGSTTAIKAAVFAGTGPAVLSAVAVAAELEAGQLVAVACDDLSLQRTVRAIWAADQPPQGHAARLLAIAGRRGA